MKCRKLAYVCFSYIALFALVYIGVSLLPLEPGTHQVFGMFSIPFVVLSAIAGAIGSIATLWCSRELPLISMSASYFGFIFIGYLTNTMTTAQRDQYAYLLDIASIVLIILIIMLSARWAFRLRIKNNIKYIIEINFGSK